MVEYDSLTIECDLYDTTSLSSGGLTSYCKGTSSVTATNYYNNLDNWGMKTKNNLFWKESNCATTNDKYSTWIECDTYGSTAATTIVKIKRLITEACENWYFHRGECECECEYKTVRKSSEDKLREILQRRQSPLVITSRKSMPEPSDIREIRARETLKRVLGDDKFKSFLKKGFISVRAKSGLVYQIFPAHGITAVYRDGEMTERLCVVLKGNFPPTDSIIMRYLLILNDERDFRKHAIKHQIIQKKTAPAVDDRSLPEIWKGLKVA
jgi:hypothetical protein